MTTVADLAERFVMRRAASQPRRLHNDIIWTCQNKVHVEMVLRQEDYLVIADKMIRECGFRA